MKWIEKVFTHRPWLWMTMRREHRPMWMSKHPRQPVYLRCVAGLPECDNTSSTVWAGKRLTGMYGYERGTVFRSDRAQRLDKRASE